MSVYADINGWKKGNPGRPKGSKNKATLFKERIFDIIANRDEELSKQDIIEIAKIGAKFVPRSVEVKGEMNHSGFIEAMVGRAKGVVEEEKDA